MLDTYDRIFNERGRAYHSAMKLFPLARRSEFELAIGQLSLVSGEVLCDIPAGGGYLADFVPADLDVRLVAVESSEVFARQVTSSRVELHLASLSDLPLRDAECHKLVSVAGLHHVIDRPPVLREMRRVLRPGGLWCILEVAEGSATAEFLNGFVNEFNTGGHQGLFVNHTFRSDLEASRFRIIMDMPCRYTWDFADETSMATFLKLLFGLDKASHSQIVAAVNRLLGCRIDEHGYHMNWELQLLLAR